MSGSQSFAGDDQLDASDPGHPDAKVVRRLAATTSTTAFACGACCAVAFFVPAATLGVFSGFLALLAKIHPAVSAIAAATVVGAWLWIAVQSIRAGRRPARITLLVMAFATMMTVLAYLVPTSAMPTMPGM